MENMNLKTFASGVDEKIFVILKGFEDYKVPYDESIHADYIVLNINPVEEGVLYVYVRPEYTYETTYAVKIGGVWSIEKILRSENSNVLEENSKLFGWEDYKILESVPTSELTFKED